MFSFRTQILMPEWDLIQYQKFVSYVIHDLSSSLDAFWFKHGYMNAIISLPFFFWKQLGPCLLGAWGGESVSDFFFFFLSFSFSLFSFSFFCFLGFMRRASDLDFSLFTFLPLGLENYNKEAQRTMRQRQFFKQYSSHTIKKTLRKILKCWV